MEAHLQEGWESPAGSITQHLTPPGISAASLPLHLFLALPDGHQSVSVCSEPWKVAGPGSVGGNPLGAVSCHHLVTAWSLAPTQSVPAQTQAAFLTCPAGCDLAPPSTQAGLVFKVSVRKWDASIVQNTAWENKLRLCI